MKQSRNKTYRRALLAGMLGTVPAAMLITTPGRRVQAQVITASLSGTVKDTSGALVPNATVTLTNSGSGAKRTIKANGSGFFTFAGITSGDYNVTVVSQGFQQLDQTSIHLDPGDSRSLGSLELRAGSEAQTVTVQGESQIPLDSGERADLITAEDIKHLSVEGRDVTELFKILPGFAIAGSQQGVSNSAYDPSQVNVSGALGNYAANGNPINGISLKLDGADITDPGNYGAAIQNVNYDQVGEVKVQVSNFGADVANGPVVVNAVTTQGTNAFHGSLYVYGRTSYLNSNDALSRAVGLPKAQDREVYPGIAIGGPVLIPGTGFNKKRTITFFAGAEDYAQRNIYAYGGAAGALVHALVPTAAMRQGTFTATELQNYLGDLYNDPNFVNISQVPSVARDGTPLPACANGQPNCIPAAYKDPGFAAIYANMPLPNQRATEANQYNWQTLDFINDDLWQVLGRTDFDPSSKNHFFARFSVERGGQGTPQVPYYNPGELNTPGGGLSTINSESAAANLTTVFGSTLTNQLYGGLGYLNQAFVSANASVLTNYPYQGAYNTGRKVLPELQNYYDASGLPRQLTPDYSLGPIFAHKFDPDGGDTVTKVWGTHTASFGVYTVRVTNNQRQPFQPTNGYIQSYYFPAAGQQITDVDGKMNTTSGNWVANNYQGLVGGYGQQNVEPQVNLYFWNTDFFANDSWRIKPRLTVNYGLRVEHLGEWTDSYGTGLAIFRPELITSSTARSPYPGFIWHALDNSVPVSGVSPKTAFLDPRVGFAWDVRGNGTTVVRGGWGEYRAHDSWNDANAAATLTQNAQTVQYNTASLSAISKLNRDPATTKQPNSLTYPSGVNVMNIATANAPGAVAGLNATDNEEPLTDTYSLTLNQALPGHMNLLIGYVGNNSRFLLNNGSNQTVALDNINAIPIGGLYKPNPYTGQVLAPVGTNVSVNGFSSVASGVGPAQINEYRPLNTANVQYGAIDVPQHNLFANYNGLQTALSRQTGRVLFNVNYTFSRALGIVGGYNNGEPANPFNIWDNYGPLSYDRRHILNASYTLEGGTLLHKKLLGGVVNGWEVSGIVNYQSGLNIVVTTSNPGFGLNGNLGPAGSTQTPINSTVFLGTPDVSLQPTVLCDPHGSGGRNYINANCFGTPNLLNNGPYRLPDLRAPGYFDADLSAQKTFQIHERQNILLRFSAFNFLNHALPTFTGTFPAQYTLNESNLNSTSFNAGSGANAAASGFGSAPYETGRRISEVELKYNF